ncbi:MAG: hypothetical protein NTY48_00720 [Candidatus Diapherotrites archaeon]|nr:hypothetical protein [Candidatus Diapherotrites archaeon]
MVARSKLASAEELTDWHQHADYDCELFFSPVNFKRHEYGNPWGYLGKSPKLLAMKVTSPNPQRLLDLAKAMAKRRPKDPIPIFDVYGNLYFPI